MLFNHLILCHPLLLLPSIFASVRVFYKESALCIRWPKYWSFTFSKNIAVVYSVQFSSVSQSCPTLCDPHGLGIPTPETCSNSYASNQWRHLTTSPSDVPFSSHLQSFPASESFPRSQFFASGGQSIRPSASASNEYWIQSFQWIFQDWFLVEWTGLIYLQSKGLSRVFSTTTAQKRQLFGPQLSSPSNSHIHTWPLEKP